MLLVKGAAECVLDRCDRVMLPDGKVAKLTPTLRSSILSCVDEMADNALRILALARRWVAGSHCLFQFFRAFELRNRICAPTHLQLHVLVAAEETVVVMRKWQSAAIPVLHGAKCSVDICFVC